ncbi:MFS general substrate transporter [Calocera cornea HHB12733]|uniref:MFS general substrate transporter n=1 Tax=Calocera cornea HHB12733 TaxID=1353952 RepID=A0A165J8T9_9BASI|nr:MFS general substrate transporter [Calocera cornea HHB12733]
MSDPTPECRSSSESDKGDSPTAGPSSTAVALPSLPAVPPPASTRPPSSKGSHRSPRPPSVSLSPVSEKQKQKQKPVDKASTPPPAAAAPASTPHPPEQERLELATRRWIDIGTVFPVLQDPKRYSMAVKVTILLVVSIVTLAAPFVGNAFLPAFTIMLNTLHTSKTDVNMTSTVFLLALGACPMWHAYFSERYGRRPVYIFTTIIFVISSVALARATDIGVVIGLRFLQAVGSSTAQSVGAGTLSDIFYPHQRGRAFGVYYVCPNLGPLLAPIFGGLLVQWRGWHAIAWFLALYGVAMWIMLFVLLPETSVALKARQAAARALPPPSSADPAPRSTEKWYSVLGKETWNHCVHPLHSLQYLAFPPIGLTTMYISICFSCTFAYSTNIPYEYAADPYDFSQISIGLVFIAGCLGQIMGSVTSGKLSDMVVIHAKKTMGDAYRPEVRLRVSWLGVPFCPIGLLIYGWTIETNQFWFVPLIGIFLFCIGLQLANSPIIAYYSEAVPGKSASIVAVHNLCRMFAGALVSAITPTAINNIGTGWFMTILAAMTALGALALEAVRRWGGRWREEREAREQEAEAMARAGEMGTSAEKGKGEKA